MKEPKENKNRETGGGLYRYVKVPVFILNVAICFGLVSLAVVIVFLSSKGGFTVSFDSAGGSEVPPQSVRYGKPAELPPDPEKTGYTFDGWYYDGLPERRWDAEKNLIEKDTVLYAKWIPVKMKILFDPDGGIYEPGSPVEKEVTFGEPYGQLPIPYKEGYLFGGWYYNCLLYTSRCV